MASKGNALGMDIISGLAGNTKIESKGLPSQMRNKQQSTQANNEQRSGSNIPSTFTQQHPFQPPHSQQYQPVQQFQHPQQQYQSASHMYPPHQQLNMLPGGGYNSFSTFPQTMVPVSQQGIDIPIQQQGSNKSPQNVSTSLTLPSTKKQSSTSTSSSNTSQLVELIDKLVIIVKNIDTRTKGIDSRVKAIESSNNNITTLLNDIKQQITELDNINKSSDEETEDADLSKQMGVIDSLLNNENTEDNATGNNSTENKPSDD